MTKDELIKYDRIVYKIVNNLGACHSIGVSQYPHFHIKVWFKLFDNRLKEFEIGTWNTHEEAEQTIKNIESWCYQDKRSKDF